MSFKFFFSMKNLAKIERMAQKGTKQNTTTTTIGFYNGNHWPIQLVISKLNLTLTLQSGEYILDSKGRKINDPFFETFADHKQLMREVSDQHVPIISVP